MKKGRLQSAQKENKMQELLENLQAQIVLISTALITITKIIKVVYEKITRKKAKTDRRDIENTKIAIDELKKELTK